VQLADTRAAVAYLKPVPVAGIHRLKDQPLCPQSHNVQTWQIGDQEYRVDRLTGRAGPEQAGKAVLAKGWNLVRYRGYATGYRQAFGLRVNAPQDVLWQLKFSPNPPCNPQENTLR